MVAVIIHVVVVEIVANAVAIAMIIVVRTLAVIQMETSIIRVIILNLVVLVRVY